MPSLMPSHLVRMPLLPNSILRPQPWEMEGISIGRVSTILNIFFRRMLLRARQKDNSSAKPTETRVDRPAAVNEWRIDSPNFGCWRSSRQLSPSMLANTCTKGRMTHTTKKTDSRIFR